VRQLALSLLPLPLRPRTLTLNRYRKMADPASLASLKLSNEHLSDVEPNDGRTWTFSKQAFKDAGLDADDVGLWMPPSIVAQVDTWEVCTRQR
jgi:hypothetical protein